MISTIKLTRANLTLVKLVATALLSCALISNAGNKLALAQQNSLDQTVPVTPKKEASLDELFAKLARQTDPIKATRTDRLLREKMKDSGSPTVNLLMGWSDKAFITQNFPRALDLLDYITVLDPEYTEAWNRRAMINLTRQDFSAALADIRRTLEIEPRHYSAWQMLAAILQIMKEDAKALDAWYHVLEIYPANQQAQKSVIDLEEKLADKDA